MHHTPPIWQMSFVEASAISLTLAPVAQATHWHQRMTGPSLRASVKNQEPFFAAERTPLIARHHLLGTARQRHLVGWVFERAIF